MRRGYVAGCSNSRWVITVFWCFGGLEMEWGADSRTLQARDDRRKDGGGPCLSMPRTLQEFHSLFATHATVHRPPFFVLILSQR